MVSNIVSYSDWSNKEYPTGMREHQPNEIIIHHTYLPRSDQSGFKVIRGIDNYHRSTNGWKMIGYHYVIDSKSLIYKCRNDAHVGAHCRPNTGKLGVCVIGNYDPGYDNLDSIVLATLIDLLYSLCKAFNIDTSKIKGHRDYEDKTCPGDGIYNKLSMIRNSVKELSYEVK